MFFTYIIEKNYAQNNLLNLCYIYLLIKYIKIINQNKINSHLILDVYYDFLKKMREFKVIIPFAFQIHVLLTPSIGLI